MGSKGPVHRAFGCPWWAQALSARVRQMTGASFHMAYVPSPSLHRVSSHALTQVRRQHDRGGKSCPGSLADVIPALSTHAVPARCLFVHAESSRELTEMA